MRLISLWQRGTTHTRERAIRAFLAASPIKAAHMVLAAEAAGADGPRRFLLDAEAYQLDPGAWRRDARRRDDRNGRR